MHFDVHIYTHGRGIAAKIKTKLKKCVLRLDDIKGRCQNHEEQTFVEMFRPTTTRNEGIQKPIGVIEHVFR